LSIKTKTGVSFCACFGFKDLTWQLPEIYFCVPGAPKIKTLPIRMKVNPTFQRRCTMTQVADIIITSARIFTSNPDQPWAEAVAMRGNKIVHVGTTLEVAEWRGNGTKLIDGEGHTLTPGFIDSHFHLLSGAMSLGTAELQKGKTLDDLFQLEPQNILSAKPALTLVDGKIVYKA
jgi:predicted amidohydrolase YtcJ